MWTMILEVVPQELEVLEFVELFQRKIEVCSTERFHYNSYRTHGNRLHLFFVIVSRLFCYALSFSLTYFKRQC